MNSNVTVPIEFNDLKQVVRHGLESNESRIYWWPVFPSIVVGSTVDKYPAVISEAEKISSEISEPLLNFKNQAEFKDTPEYISNITKKLLYVLNNQNILKTDDMHGFDTLLRIIIFQLKRIDVCYNLASILLSNRDRFLEPNSASRAGLLHSFREILSSYAPKTTHVLTSMGALEDKYLNMIFIDLFVEIFPSNVVLRIMDAFLLEGIKILFRYGLALIRGYKTQLKEGIYLTATDFWLSVKADATSDAGRTGATMLYKSLGREEVLPPVDPFIIFSKARNADFLSGSLLSEYFIDNDRNVLAKLYRPMMISTNRIRTLRSSSCNVNNNSSNPSATSTGLSTATNIENNKIGGDSSFVRKASISSNNISTNNNNNNSFMNVAKRTGSVSEMVINSDSSSSGGNGSSSSGSSVLGPRRLSISPNTRGSRTAAGPSSAASGVKLRSASLVMNSTMSGSATSPVISTLTPTTTEPITTAATTETVEVERKVVEEEDDSDGNLTQELDMSQLSIEYQQNDNIAIVTIAENQSSSSSSPTKALFPAVEEAD